MNIDKAWVLGDVTQTPLVGTRENVDRFLEIDRALDDHCRNNFLKALDALKAVADCRSADEAHDVIVNQFTDLIEELEEVEV